MSVGRQSPSTCIPHHDEYASDDKVPKCRRSTHLSPPRKEYARRGTMPSSMRGGTVAERVRSLNAAFSSSLDLPSLVVLPPREEQRDPEDRRAQERTERLQDDKLATSEPSLLVMSSTTSDTSEPSHRQASTSRRGRVQGALVRSRSNPFIRRDSSAATPPPPAPRTSRGSHSSSPSLSPSPALWRMARKTSGSRSKSSRMPVLHSPSPLRKLELGALKAHEEGKAIGEKVSEEAGTKGMVNESRRRSALTSTDYDRDRESLMLSREGMKADTKWAKMLWNVWEGLKGGLPARQGFVDAVDLMVTEQRAQRARTSKGEHEFSADSSSKDDQVLHRVIGNKSPQNLETHESYDVRSNDIPGDSPSQRPIANRLTTENAAENSNVLNPPIVMQYHNADSDGERHPYSELEGAKPHHSQSIPLRTKDLPWSDSTPSVGSISPWPDFDDVGFVPSSNGDEKSDGTSVYSSASATQSQRIFEPNFNQNGRQVAVDSDDNGGDDDDDGKHTPQPKLKLNQTSQPGPSAFVPGINECRARPQSAVASHLDVQPGGTAIAIRLGDMFDAIIIARGGGVQPDVRRLGTFDTSPKVNDEQRKRDRLYNTKEDHNDNNDNRQQQQYHEQAACLQDLQKISDDLMARTRVLLGDRHGAGEDGYIVNVGSGQGDRKGSCKGRGKLSGKDEEVMSVPILLRLVDCTAKDLGLKLPVKMPSALNPKAKGRRF